jgi:hypothetical protein
MPNVVVDGSMDEFLKENVYPTLQDVINLRSVERQLFAGVERRPIEGKWFRVHMLTRGNFVLSGRAERDILPGMSTDITNANDTTSDLEGIECRFNRKQLYTTLQITGPAQKAGRGAGGFEELGKLVLKQTQEALPESVSRQWATGMVCPLAEVTSFAAAVVTVDPANNPATEAAAVPWAGNRYIREGLVVDFVAGAAGAAVITGALRNATAQNERGRKVNALSVDGATATVTLDATLAGSAIASGDLMIPFRTRAAAAITVNSSMEAAWQNAMGILDAVQNSADPHYSVQFYGTLDRTAAANRVLQSRILNTGVAPAALTINLVNRLLEQIRLDPLSGDEPDCGYCHESIWRRFAESNNVMTFTSNNPVRFMEPGKGFKPTIGVSGININTFGTKGNFTVYTSPFAPMYRFYAISRKYLSVLEERPLSTLDTDGLSWRMVNNNTDDYRMTLAWYCTGIINRKPIASGYLVNILGDQNN